MNSHPLDRAVAWLSQRSNMFARGWGEEANLTASTKRELYLAEPRAIRLAWKDPRDDRGAKCCEGNFQSPCDALPDTVRMAHVRWWSKAGNTAACVLLAASRDEGYSARERVFCPLTERGVDLFLLENPFYGLRRNGHGPSDLTVAEHCIMCLGSVLEARALLTWLKFRYAKLAVAGYSMGGHMAALTAAVTPLPVACAALAAGASPVPNYTVGLLSQSVDFAALGGERGRRRLASVFSGADIAAFRPPLRVNAAVIAGCLRDGYVPKSETERLHAHWKGSTLRWIDAGHFSAVIMHREALRRCVAEAVEKL